MDIGAEGSAGSGGGGGGEGRGRAVARSNIPNVIEPLSNYQTLWFVCIHTPLCA